MLIVKLVITEAYALAFQITEGIPTLKAVNQVRQTRYIIFKLVCKPLISIFLSVPEPVVEEQDCRTDVDCASLEICYQSGGRNRCVDPCTTISPCVTNAACRVHSTTPTRTMSCICFEGFTGNGVVSCDKISKLLYCCKNSKVGCNFYIFPLIL